MIVSANQRGIFLSHVTQRKTLCREHFELVLRLDHFPDCAPGQFVQILCRDPADLRPSTSAMLRRPFSVGGLRRESNHVDINIIGRVIGPGTAWLDSRKEGDAVDILGPLGRPFTMPQRDAQSFLVAGGVGLPPIRWLCEKLREYGSSCEFFFGAQTSDLIPFELIEKPSTDGVPSSCAALFNHPGVRTAITTDDGSVGMRGRITDALVRRLDRSDTGPRLRVFACGPEPMLEAVAALCELRKVACEVALERVMGCGMATCQSCVVPVKDSVNDWKYALCCRDGPVFDAGKVVWGRH